MFTRAADPIKYLCRYGGWADTVIPRLTSDPANEFSVNEALHAIFGLG
jgi:hypothetical protein